MTQPGQLRLKGWLAITPQVSMFYIMCGSRIDFPHILNQHKQFEETVIH